MLEAEAAFDTQIAVRYRVIAWGRDFYNCVVLHMQSKRTTYATIWADRICLGLLGLVPCAIATHFVFASKHQSTSWANLDAITTIDTCRIG